MRAPSAQSFLLIVLLLACSLLSAQQQPTSPQHENVFANDSGTTNFPFELKNGMIVIPVSLRGSQPLHFVLDSGSTRILLDRALATSLGFKAAEESSLQGAGAGRIPIQAVHDVALVLPGLNTNGYDCFMADLSPLEKADGTRVDGIIGYEFFARFVVTIDFTAQRMTVALPSAFHPDRKAEALPLEVRDKWPFVKGALVMPGPVTVQDTFLIDSGSSDEVDHPVVKNMQSRISAQSGVGLGTPVEGATAKATSFRLGHFTLKTPTVACCGATEQTSRLIGTEVLRRFTVTFDYPSARLFLTPNKTYLVPLS